MAGQLLISAVNRGRARFLPELRTPSGGRLSPCTTCMRPAIRGAAPGAYSGIRARSATGRRGSGFIVTTVSGGCRRVPRSNTWRPRVSNRRGRRIGRTSCLAAATATPSDFLSPPTTRISSGRTRTTRCGRSSTKREASQSPAPGCRAISSARRSNRGGTRSSAARPVSVDGPASLKGGGSPQPLDFNADCMSACYSGLNWCGLV